MESSKTHDLKTPLSMRPAWANTDPLLRTYYDEEWGFPVTSESGLFERLTLEAFQAGLSWLLVLRRRPVLRKMFADFDPERVARFTDFDVERILATPEMIRNERKIRATITNAQATLDLRDRGGLSELVWSFAPTTTEAEPIPAETELPNQSEDSAALAAELKRHGFVFVGPVSMYAMMEATGMIDHRIKSG